MCDLLTPRIMESVTNVTLQDCRGWIRHSIAFYLLETHFASSTLKHLPAKITKKQKNIGEAGRRSQCLSHAKRALYHLSYIPFYHEIGDLKNSDNQTTRTKKIRTGFSQFPRTLTCYVRWMLKKKLGKGSLYYLSRTVE
ncbi:hypothetical protein BD770DRAFT_416605 [Pilaira anomala]|nr:hypothetical protein BD770DRAFT_416605 [Pilaira anomala]